MSALRFNGESGKKPSAQARRYIYERLAVMLMDDMRDRPRSDSFVLREINNEFDERRVRNEAKKVVAELERKAKR